MPTNKFLSPMHAKLKPYVPGEQPKSGHKELLKLNTNESPFAPSPLVSRLLTNKAASLAENLRLYPDPENAKLCEKYGRLHSLLPLRVFAGNGSDEVLAFIFQALFLGGRVAFPDITYGFYEVYCSLYHINAEIIPLKDDFTIDIDAFCRTDSHIVLANPNAPTGIALTLAEVEKIVSSRKTTRVVVIDEAYIDFGGESAVPLLKKYLNLIIVHTFSKSRSLAGARLGFALSNNPIIDSIKMIKYSFNSYSVNRLTEAIGLATLNDPSYFRNCCLEIIETREYFSERLKELGFTVLDSKANFVFAKHPTLSGKELYEHLRGRLILVRHFDKPRIRDFVRITIGTRAQMQKLLEALK